MNIYCEILLAVGIIFFVFFIRKILSKTVIFLSEKIFLNSLGRKNKVFKDFFKKHVTAFIMLITVTVVLHVFSFPTKVESVFKLFVQFLFLWICAVVISDAINTCFEIFISKKFSHNQAASGLLRFFKRLINIFIGIVFSIVFINICGFSVSGLLTTLGLGGVALALASKDSLANLFGSVSLICDHVFKVGDHIKFGDNVEGIVEDIGLRSTKIRTDSKSLITVPNATLANVVIDNLSQSNDNK